MVRQKERKTRDPKKLPAPSRPRFSDIWRNPEVIANMAASWAVNFGQRLPQFFLAKFPYVQAVTLLMLLGERGLKMEKYPPMHPKMIYSIAGVCFVTGIMMSFKIKTKVAALVYVGLQGYLAWNAYSNVKFNYSSSIRWRISSRHLGCIGVYMILAFLTDKKNLIIQRVGELCVAAYLLATAYSFNNIYEDKRAIHELLPGGDWMRYFLIVVYGSAGICFLSGYFLRDISMSMAFCLTFMSFLVDMRFAYWSYRGVMYWNQMRIAIDALTILAGFFLFINTYEDQMKPKDEDEDEDDDDDNEEEDKKKQD